MEAAVSRIHGGAIPIRRRAEARTLHQRWGGRNPPLLILSGRCRSRRPGPPITAAARGVTGNGSQPPERSEDEEIQLNTRKEELRCVQGDHA